MKKDSSYELEKDFFFTDGPINKLLNTVFRNGFMRVLITISFAFLFCYLPIRLLNQWEITKFSLLDNPALNFSKDYSAIAQLFLAIPMYILARPVIGYSWKSIIESINALKLDTDEGRDLIAKINKLREIAYSKVTEIIIILICFAFPIYTLITEHLSSNISWYTFYSNSDKVLSFAGLYAWLISIPIFLMLTIYWLRQITAWIFVLYFYSTSGIKYNAFHPDGCCGLGFIRQSIKGFTILIFAQGIVQVATIMYKVNIQSVEIFNSNIIILVFSYIIIAPLLFIVPLTFFTVGITKSRDDALHKLGSTIRLQKLNNIENIGGEKYLEYKELQDYYKELKSIAVWPVDIKSVLSLFLSAVLPMTPVLIRLLKIPVPDWILQLIQVI